MTVDEAIRLFSALLTPLIAIVATYIAWQQWKTNRQKLALDLYERRLHIYQEVRKTLGLVMRDGSISLQILLEFYSSVSEAHFLFGPEIAEYIDEIYKHGTELGLLTEEREENQKHRQEDYDFKKAAAQIHLELAWFVHQSEPAREKFKKYLRLSA